MVSYTYRCESCGAFEVRAAMGMGVLGTACPRCAGPAKRVFTPPRVGRSPSDPRMRLLDATKRSAFEPQVVDSVPGRGRRRRQAVTRDPRHSALPRP
jgi:putative FmdB family regulatory protein